MGYVNKKEVKVAFSHAEYERLEKLHSLEKKKCSMNTFLVKIVSQYVTDRNRDLIRLAEEEWKDSDFD